MEILSDPVLGVWDPVSDREHQFYPHPSLPPLLPFTGTIPLSSHFHSALFILDKLKEKQKHFLVSGLGHRL